MQKPTYVALAAIWVLIACGRSDAAERGMYLCRSPVFANDFWGDLVGVHQAGVQMNSEIVASVARKHGCGLVQSSDLRPIKFVAGMFEITDGISSGFSSADYYIIYANQPYLQRK